MADRPILFSAPMIRALLDGRKTQTRRQIKPRGNRPSIFNGDWSDSYVLDPENENWRQQDIRIAAGDRLYVREHWRTDFRWDDTAPRDLDPELYEVPDKNGYCRKETFFIAYEADSPGFLNGKHRQAMHMPRWLSRLTLTVTDVRVERLQDISEADAKAEGVSDEFTDYELYGQSQPYRFGYSSLWNLINGEGAWEANPWVMAVSFEVHRGNIDQIGRVAA